MVLDGIQSTTNMGKRKKRQQTPQLHLHLHMQANPTEQSPGFTRRAFALGRRAFLTVLGNVAGGWVFEKLFHNAPAPKVVTIEPPTIGPTNVNVHPPGVESHAYIGDVALRINVSSSILVADAFEAKSPSAS